LSAHKAAQKTTFGSPIISDLSGHRRVHYKNKKALTDELHKMCKQHPYTIRFEKALAQALKGKSKGDKKSGRSLALKIIREIDDKEKIRRTDLVQNLQAKGYTESEINALLKKLHSSGVVICTVGKFSEVRIA
jgi:hypothetical protein